MSGRKHNYASVMLRSLADFKEIENCFDAKWFFRGQRCSCWDLETSMERKDSELERTKYAAFERNSLLEAGKLLEWDADTGDGFSRLAFLQHHGCKTRLLDFTHCLDVALYFAAESGPCKKNGCPAQNGAIWAISKSALETKIQQLGGDSGVNPADASRRLIMEAIKKGDESRDDGQVAVVFCRPLVPNPRIVAQKGLFLAPLNLDKDFKTNLTIGLNLTGAKEPVRRLGSVDELPSALGEEDVIKLILAEDMRSAMLADLEKRGINHGALFPDLDAFAKGLNEWRPRREAHHD
jgi:hypothetical protein